MQHGTHKHPKKAKGLPLDTGILQGWAATLDRLLRLSSEDNLPARYATEDALQRLLTMKDGLVEATVDQLLNELFMVVQQNFRSPRKSRTLSQDNWRWKEMPRIAQHNPSREKSLEKMIARHGGREWVNQMPAASGFMGPDADKKRAIDLVRKLSDSVYHFYELKTDRGAGHPFFALVEMLSYGMLYLLARSVPELQRAYAESPIIQAKFIGLRVLAPADYYREKEDLRHLERVFSTSLQTLASKKVAGLGMDFRFERFGEAFSWEASQMNDPRLQERLTEALASIQPLHPAQSLRTQENWQILYDWENIPGRPIWVLALALGVLREMQYDETALNNSGRHEHDAIQMARYLLGQE